MRNETPNKRAERPVGASSAAPFSTPPSHTGVSAVKGVSVFTATRRNLPHWEDPGSVYFVTWRTAQRTCLTGDERTLTLAAIRHWDGIRWTLYAAVVMPDHVHILVQPLRIPEEEPTVWYPLGSILHSVKSYSAHQINQLRGQSGAVWQDEREDRIIRSENEFWEKWEYTRNNPVEENLAATAEDYPWFYQQGGLQPDEAGSVPE